MIKFNIMKKAIFIISLLFCVSFNSSAQIYCSGYFDGYWSDWKSMGTGTKIKGGYDGFIIYLDKEGPWNYRFKFTIDNYNVPDKKQRKKDIKEDRWYVFSGTVEYYVTDKYPTILSIFRESKGPMLAPAKLDNGKPTRKITSKATIKIAAFKKSPQIYNIWFDNVGLGLNLNHTYK